MWSMGRRGQTIGVHVDHLKGTVEGVSKADSLVNNGVDIVRRQNALIHQAPGFSKKSVL
jgi:hypothetical protein